MPRRSTPRPGALPAGMTDRDWEVSATVRDLPQLDKAVRSMQDSLRGRARRNLLDMGCGIGGLTMYLAERLGATDVHGVDIDDERLAVARGRGVNASRLDLERDRIPLDDGSIDIVVSFGAFEHFVWYDNTVAEAARVLAPGGSFLLSMPNLGSYVNRFALLFGYQPRDVEISQQVFAGVLPRYQRDPAEQPLAHVHSATLRAMRQLLAHYGFTQTKAWGFSPYFGARSTKVFDKAFGSFPSWSRRFIVLSRRAS